MKKAIVLGRPAETAEYFQISLMTLYRWSKAKGFPQPLKRGKIVLYNLPDIAAWLSSGEV